MEFLPEYGLALSSGTVALFRRANGSLAAFFAEIFEKFTECTNEMYGIAEREAFVRGFTLGARIIIEIMNTEIE